MADKLKGGRFQDVELYLRTGRYKANRNENEKRVIRHMVKKFAIEEGELLYTAKGSKRRVLRSKPDLERVLRECHDNSAHQGTRRTQDKIALHYYWPTMTHDVNEWVKMCSECQKSSNITAMPPPLQSIQTNDRWEVLGMDLVALPETPAGNRYLLTVTDLFTKYIFLRALRNKTAKSVCDAVLDLFHTFGPPQRIITDQGREFVNAVNAELFRSFGVRHSITSAYHPQCNGQAERTNQTVKQALAKYVNDQQNDWDKYLGVTAYGINCSSQCSTERSPFFLMFLRHPKSVGGMNQETSATDMVVLNSAQPQTVVPLSGITEIVEQCHSVVEKVRTKLRSVQEKQATQYNTRKRKGKRLFTVCPGDQVMKKNVRKETRQGGRLQPNFTGPYTVKAITSSGQCTLVNSAGLELATRYNISLMKPYIGQTAEQLSPPQSSSQLSPNEGNASELDVGLVQEQEATEDQGARSGDCLSSEPQMTYERQLVDFILTSTAVQEHVTAVTLEKKPSPLHTLFTKTKKTWRERSDLMLQGFGPIEIDNNVFAITKMLERYLCEAMQRPKAHKDIYYITDVLFPEAVIFAIQQLGDLTRDEAEELFRNYVPRSQD